MAEEGFVDEPVNEGAEGDEVRSLKPICSYQLGSQLFIMTLLNV